MPGSEISTKFSLKTYRESDVENEVIMKVRILLVCYDK